MDEVRRNSIHWGEYSPVQEIEEMSEDLADIMIQNAMKPLPIGLYQPCGHQEEGVVGLPKECSAMDDTVLHTIKLLQYAKKMQCIIDKLKSKDTNDMEDVELAVFPEQLDKKPVHRMVYPFRYMERIPTSFIEGIGLPPHRLNESNARRILQKCVATIFAHIGYDTTSKAVLDVMTDVSEEYIMKLTSLLRVAIDRPAVSGNDGFPDVMERAFHEMGIGSVLTLHSFYQERILIYHENILARCRKLADEYATLTAPVVKEETVRELVKCKIENEEVEDDVDVPEIHFPALGDGYSVDELQPSLEPGFQMLHSLEQEEQLQNMEQEEEITVSDSPGQNPIVEVSSEVITTSADFINKYKKK